MKRVDIFVANDAEARELSGEINLVKAARKLRSFGPQMIVVKKGEHGVLFYCDDFIFSFPAYPVARIVDPTGAGDTFAGGFMGYLTRVKKITERNLKTAVAFGTVIASFNVEGFGLSRVASLSRREINQRFKHFQRIISLWKVDYTDFKNWLRRFWYLGNGKGNEARFGFRQR